MESEYIAAARGAQELLGCHELLQEIGSPSQQPMLLNMDNRAAIAQITSEASSQRSKHIDTKHKFLKDLCYKENLKPIHVPTKSKLADLMTKAFPTPDFRRLCALIGLVDPKYQNDVDTICGLSRYILLKNVGGKLCGTQSCRSGMRLTHNCAATMHI
jgi:hypothetical protein